MHALFHTLMGHTRRLISKALADHRSAGEHDDRYPVLHPERTLSITESGWVTIATAATARATGRFFVYDISSGKHNLVELIASTAYGHNQLVAQGGVRSGTRSIAHARILFDDSNRTQGGAKLQVYCEGSGWTLRIRAMLLSQINGWNQWQHITPIAEGTPAGWVEDPNASLGDITNQQYTHIGRFKGDGTELALYTITTTSTNKTLSVREHCEVTASGRTITLPPAPVTGDAVIVAVGNFVNTVINRNGSPIMGADKDFMIDKPHVPVTFTYINSTIGWRIG